MGRTPTLNLSTFVAGEDIHGDSNKFFNRDRLVIDSSVLAMLSHQHGGAGGEDATPTDPADLELDQDLGGIITSGRRVWYVYTLVDANGLETGPSPETYIDTPAAVADPGAPAGIALETTGGSLLPGTHYYKLSAYVGQSTVETRAGAPTYKAIPPGTSTNVLTFDLPSLPAGATGFNVYRRKPGGDYAFLASIDMDVPTPPSEFVDDGSIVDDCVRRLPTANRTGGTNAIVVTIPEVPAGYTWRLYRTYTSGVWDESLVDWIVEETEEESGIITPEYTDMGYSLGGSRPPEQTFVMPAFDSIDLVSGTVGSLGPGRVAHPTEVVIYQAPGPVEAGDVYATTWVCEYPFAKIVGVRAALGPGASPAVDPVVVDVGKGTGLAPTFISIFGAEPKPTIEVGDSLSSRVMPDNVDLEAGDAITVVIEQAGGGLTPTDTNLTVTMYLVTYGFPTVVFDPNDEDTWNGLY